MTKREKQIKSMLDYFQIEMSGGKDEKMNKREQKKFLDNLNANYDAQTVHDIFSKIKDKFKNERPEEDEESDDPFFDSLKKDSDKNKKDDFHFDSPFPMSDKFMPWGKGSFGPINPEIEKFLDWMTDLLYSADHKVTITEEGNITNIKLEKIKKKGGRKK